MKKYTISGLVTRRVEVQADTLAEGVKLWQAEAGEGYPADWEETLGPDDDPDTQEGGFIVGGCESCGHPILDDEPHNYDDEGTIWHRDEDPCPPALTARGGPEDG